MMEIKKAYPPNYDQIVKVFPSARREGTLFAYLDAVYWPGKKIGEKLPVSLIAHEQVHLARQGGTEESAAAWWNRYLVDPEFRYAEELLAHCAEFRAMTAANKTPKFVDNCLTFVASRLASGLYGSVVTRQQAAEDILRHV